MEQPWQHIEFVVLLHCRRATHTLDHAVIVVRMSLQPNAAVMNVAGVDELCVCQAQFFQVRFFELKLSAAFKGL